MGWVVWKRQFLWFTHSLKKIDAWQADVFKLENVMEK